MNEEELLGEGWKPTSISGGTHLQRTLDMYRELGFEVRLEEVSGEECGECTVCYQEAGETIYRIYTRPREDEATG